MKSIAADHFLVPRAMLFGQDDLYRKKERSDGRPEQRGKKPGYVPEKDNTIFARLMDVGKLLQARIKKIEKKGSFTRVSTGIYLVDF